MKAIILAAGMGTRLEQVTGGMPKCMVPVAGTALIDRMIQGIGNTAIDELIVVTGHEAERLRDHIRGVEHPLAAGATFVHNERYAEWGNFYSLLVAEAAVGGASFVKLDGDVLFDDEVLARVLAAPGPAALAIDCREGMGEEEMKVRVEQGKVVALNKRMDPSEARGEYIGIDRVDAELVDRVFEELRVMIEAGETDEYYERAYERLAQSGVPYQVADVTGCTWAEIDDEADLQAANRILGYEA